MGSHLLEHQWSEVKKWPEDGFILFHGVCVCICMCACIESIVIICCIIIVRELSLDAACFEEKSCSLDMKERKHPIWFVKQCQAFLARLVECR
jgi:hypothetical protein